MIEIIITSIIVILAIIILVRNFISSSKGKCKCSNCNSCNKGCCKAKSNN